MENRKERVREGVGREGGGTREREVIVHHTPDPKHLSAFRPTGGAALTSAS